MWDLYQTLLGGGMAEKYGAGPVLFEALREELGSEPFMLLVEFLNEIDAGLQAALPRPEPPKKEPRTRYRELN